jgi:hypothetical protein
MRKILLGGFLKKISQNGDRTRIYKYKENGKLLTFLRVDDLVPGKKYFGSFNSLDSIRGGKMGEALLTRALEEEGKDADILASSVPGEDIFLYYINHGFIGNGMIMNFEKTGLSLANIERKKEKQKHYYVDYADEDIIKEYEANFFDSKHLEEKYLILKFDLKKNKKGLWENQEMNEKMRELTEKKYIITKGVNKKKSGEEKTFYLCFEKQ